MPILGQSDWHSQCRTSERDPPKKTRDQNINNLVLLFNKSPRSLFFSQGQTQ